jgi:two-component system, NtrC family, response regulator AtoC
MGSPRILIVDDDVAIRNLLVRFLQNEGCEIDIATSASESLEKVRKNPPNLVFLDLYLPDSNSLRTLEKILELIPNGKVIMMTGHAEIATAVEAMKFGAIDFLLKPLAPQKLKAAMEMALLKPQDDDFRLLPKPIVGESPKMKAIWTQVNRYAIPDINILLLGESGTGKELFARAIHDRSKRANKQFVAIDCAVLPETLVESEIFGYEKGAFTGALGRKAGKFELADEGTLFLDEIGNLPPHVQAKLLRVLQERCIEPLGGQKPVSLDLRIISATNLNLEEAIRDGRFREDLYYRLAEVSFILPPLREREGDVALLSRYFIEIFNKKYGRQIQSISDSALEILTKYRWPGNVRELENVIKTSLLACNDIISRERLPEFLLKASDDKTSVEEKEDAFLREFVRQKVDQGLKSQSLDVKMLAAQVVEEFEKKLLIDLLNRRNFTQAELSGLLKIDSKTLRAKLQKFGLSGFHLSLSE